MDSFECTSCHKSFPTAEDHIKHQQLHVMDYNFHFRCPFLSCLQLRFKSLRDLTSHIESFHKLQATAQQHHQPPSSASPTEAGRVKCSRTDCSFTAASKVLANAHAIEHLKKKECIFCVPGGCDHAEAPFQTLGTYRVHLSQYHRGWANAISSATDSVGAPALNPSETSSLTSSVTVSDDYHQMDCDDSEERQLPGGAHNFASAGNAVFEDDDVVVKHIARFYLMLQADANVPASTVQEVANYITGISEIVQARYKTRVLKSLQKYNIPEDELNRLIYNLQSSDPLYCTHHTFMPGPNLTTEYFRQEFNKKYFGYKDSIEIGLSTDRKSDLKVQYVPIKTTIQEMLEEPSIQKQVDESFSRSSVEGRLSDYHHGSVVEKRNQDIGSSEVIDILVFQDAFSVSCALGSAKNKFKILGTYLTLGNLKPHVRSMLKSMRLVLLFREKIMKKIQDTHEAIAKAEGTEINRSYGQEKCFHRFLTDLRVLVRDGVMYKGRKVSVRLCHVLGDNLGSHFIGGFRQYFTSGYICRFCPMTLQHFREECENGSQKYTLELRTKLDYMGCAWEAALKDLVHVKAVKFVSILDGIGDYDVCDGLPPCLAHDFFEGVASEDLALIIRDLVSKKWFTYKELNARIASFNLKGADSTNKPAPVNLNKKKRKQKKKEKVERIKLGGHAVQNWTLIRFLPYFIGDKIQDVEDPTWQFYLCLKELCECLCAKSSSIADLNYLKHVLTPRYMQARAELFGADSMLSKHHLICHYADLIIKFGPVFYLWTLRFESFHSYFKTVARYNNNFINIERSLALRYQLKSCYMSSGNLFDDGTFILGTCSKIGPENLTLRETEVLGPLLNMNSCSVSAISIDGLKYNVGDCLVLNRPQEELPDLVIGKVLHIVYDGVSTILLMKKIKAVLQSSYGVYCLKESLDPELVCEKVTCLSHPTVQPTYDFRGSESFPLKHSFMSDN